MSKTRRWHLRPSFSVVLVLSTIIRVGLIIYSEWHDAQPGVLVKYTDVDYRVFTDAARYVVRDGLDGVNDEAAGAAGYRSVGGSIAKGLYGAWLRIGDPYDRDTYRYTPLLALFMTPNVLLFRSFGKFVFAGCDILVGILIRRILLETILPKLHPSSNHDRTNDEGLSKESTMEQCATLYASIHLLNPLVFSISTRGSSESVIGALVVAILYFTLACRWDAAAVMLGIAAHWKIYPVVYGASLIAVLASPTGKGSLKRQNAIAGMTRWVGSLVNKQTLRFGVISGGTFMALNVIMYFIWGDPFLQHSFLYHLHRLDHRHNFSPFFLPIYLSYPPHDTHASYSAYLVELNDLSFWSKVVRSPLASFVPQMCAALGTGLILTKPGRLERLPFVWFVQTAAFVTFNKVCTSQYFLWYITLLPLLLPSLRLSRLNTVLLLTIWPASQALWLKTGYELEFLGKNVYFELWVWSVVFLAVNVWAIGVVILGYRGA